MNTCSHCHRELRSDAPYLFYCGDVCRRQYHDGLTRSMPTRRQPAPPQRQPIPGEAALLADRAAAAEAAENRRRIGQAETMLAGQRKAADTARLYAEQEAAMISKLALGRGN
ncbi:hypothetical protein [Mycobacterium sp. 94-17]|uniref:hypothetical protein n=1 Tax=Mycobacterium sp. 94-17 TaxID=2986147 RepID=UPI002D1EEB85|nr:hypothetical protein [Mycobacterium sp. 94-17]MEB4210974.1 hypothetical protein [Mycobacterium sp. 94-17]